MVGFFSEICLSQMGFVAYLSVAYRKASILYLEYKKYSTDISNSFFVRSKTLSGI